VDFNYQHINAQKQIGHILDSKNHGRLGRSSMESWICFAFAAMMMIRSSSVRGQHDHQQISGYVSLISPLTTAVYL